MARCRHKGCSYKLRKLVDGRRRCRWHGYAPTREERLEALHRQIAELLAAGLIPYPNEESNSGATSR